MSAKQKYIQELEVEFGVEYSDADGFDTSSSEGEKAQERLEGFDAGYTRGYDDAALELMEWN